MVRLVLTGKPNEIMGQLVSMVGVFGDVPVTKIIRDMEEWHK